MKPDLLKKLYANGFDVKEGKYNQNAIHVKGSGSHDAVDDLVGW